MGGTATLRAAPAGDRPAGIATRSRAIGGDPDLALTDRAHAPSAPLSPEGRDLHDRFTAAIDDDLDLSTALAIARETLRADLPDDERRWLVLDADAVLGLDLGDAAAGARRRPDAPAIPDDIAALLHEREQARADRDFVRADAIRSDLAALGWDVTDTASGPALSRR